jgi:hypothetical protein
MSTFDWNDYIALATAMHSLSGATEAQLRCAISRAYYGAYNQAHKRFVADGQRLSPGGSSHSQVWRFFQSHPDPNYRQIGTIGDRAKGRRVKADYKDRYPNLAFDAGVTLTDVLDVVQRLSLIT